MHKALALIVITSVVFGTEVVLMFPKIDLDNSPIDFYSIKYGCVEEITVVFKDEDYPNKFMDIVYDAYRMVKWGRIEDAETFYIKGNTVIFPDDYSGDATFYQTKNLHNHAEISIAEFQKKSGKILVYVNTWNHMFSNKAIAGLEYIPFYFTPKVGSREDVERIYSIYK